MKIIAAIGKNREIGFKNQLPWHNKEELNLFKAYTYQNAVLMGRKTFESLLSPLPQRINIVMSRNEIRCPKVDWVEDLPSALELSRIIESGFGTVYVIGGAKVYQEFLPYVDELIISHMDVDVAEADAYFPAFEHDWKEHYSEERKGFRHVIYRRK